MARCKLICLNELKRKLSFIDYLKKLKRKWIYDYWSYSSYANASKCYSEVLLQYNYSAIKGFRTNLFCHLAQQLKRQLISEEEIKYPAIVFVNCKNENIILNLSEQYISIYNIISLCSNYMIKVFCKTALLVFLQMQSIVKEINRIMFCLNEYLIYSYWISNLWNKREEQGV